MAINNIPVIKIPGLITDNEFLPVFTGIDLSKPMPQLKINFGVVEISGWYNVKTQNPNAGQAVSDIPENQCKDASGALTRAFLETSEDWFMGDKNTDYTGTENEEYLYCGYSISNDAGSMSASIKIKNLDPEKTYKAELLASRFTSASNDRVGNYSWNGEQSVQINALNNTDSTIWSELNPDPNGDLVLLVEVVGSSNYYSYVNWLTIEEN